MLCRQAALSFAIFTTVCLLQLAVNNASRSMEPNSIHDSEASCRKDDIQVIQVPTGVPLPSGNQVFSVQILNECQGGPECNIRNIHISCGSFHSQMVINPHMFRLLGDNDCLVNDGNPIASGAAVSFSYAWSTQIPLSVSSVTC